MLDSDTTAQLSRSDHDVLIRLETKMDQVVGDINELKNGTATRIASLELRINAREKAADEFNAPVVIKRINDIEKRTNQNAQDIHDFRLLTWALVVLCSTIGFILSNVSNVVHLFGK